MMKAAHRFEEVQGSDIRAVMEKTKALEAANIRVAHFEIGRPDFDTPEPIKRATITALEEGKVHYGPNAGVPELREAVSEYLGQRYGLSFPSARILVTNGAIEGVFISLMSVIDPGDEVLILEPSWPYYIQMVRIMGGVPKLVPANFVDGYRPDMTALSAACGPRTRAILVNSPNNPTGSELDARARRDLAAFAKEHGLLLVADEVYESIRLTEAPFASIVQEPEVTERAVLVGAFSKSHSMTGWRLGYVALPETLVNPALLAHTYINTSVNTFIQYGGVAALKETDLQRKDMDEAYKERHQIALSHLKAMPGVTCHPSQGGFFVFPHFENFPDDRMLAKKLLDEAHVATVPGSSFGATGKGHLRLSFACDTDTLVYGLERIDAWLRSNEQERMAAAR